MMEPKNPLDYLTTFIGNEKAVKNYLSIAGMSQSDITDFMTGNGMLPLKISRQISKEYSEFNAKEFLKIEDTYVNYIDHKHIEDLSALFLIKKDQVLMLTSGEYNERHCDYIVTALEDFDSHKLGLEFNEHTSPTDKDEIEIAFYKWLENRGVVKFHNFSEIHVSYEFGSKKKEICLTSL